MRIRGYAACGLGCVALICGGWARGQEQAARQDDSTRKLSAKEQKQRKKKFAKETGDVYGDWLREDVPYIISDEEKAAFLRLETNEERDQFIEDFWRRRNPDPESLENTFKEEHYRRIAYANEHFASGIPGWKTDRGHVYILWGPPDEIESHPTGGTYDRPMEEGGGSTTTYPWEKWRYRHLEGIKENVELEFVDPSGSGEYHITTDPSEKDALTHVPGAGPSFWEQIGMYTKAQRFANADGTTLPATPGGRSAGMDEFERMELLKAVMQPPKYKDLEALVSVRMVRNQLHLEYGVEYLRMTPNTVLVPITVQLANREMEFREVKGVHSATLDVYLRISTLTGRVVQTFDEVVARDFPESLFSTYLPKSSVYQKAVPLAPGLYRLDVVVKDEANGNVGVIGTALRVPRYEEEKLDASSLVLADQIEAVPSAQVGSGPFVIGARKVRPRIGREFTNAEKLGIYLQVYNLELDDDSHRTDSHIEYRIRKGNEEIWKAEERPEEKSAGSEQLTIERFLPLATIAPGAYTLEIRVTDRNAQSSVVRTAEFSVKAPAGERAATAAPSPK